MKRSTFLPAFFIALAIVFGVAVWMRLSAYSDPATQNANVATRAMDETRPEGRAASGTYEIVDEGTTTMSASARQQRYNELLKTAPPAPVPPAPPPDNESLFDRIVNPVATALGMNRPKPEKVAAAQPPTPPQPRPQQPQQQQQPQSDENTRNPEQPKEEPDAETDVAPPQLLGAQFIPAEIQDDGETMLAATVTDNLSGVRSVSGVIASPTNAMQGFACQREGETDRYVARIKIPRDAAEGTWAVKYLTLTDNANNSINLNQSSGALPQSASFKVTSNSSDSKAPVLASVELERRAMNAGERNTVFVTAEDDKSGLSLVSGVFVSPSKQARIGFGCRAGAGGAWECTVAPPACLDCGTWQLEQIQLQDKANNMATFRADNPVVQRVTLDISGDRCDARPPQITQLTLEPPVVSNAEGGTINVRAVVSDDVCGVASLSGQAVPSGAQGGQRIYFSFDPSPDGTNFFGRIIVPKHAAKGTWAIGWIQALDKGHNLKAYASNDPVLARVTFRVE